jgi:hypothetical protein
MATETRPIVPPTTAPATWAWLLSTATGFTAVIFPYATLIWALARVLNARSGKALKRIRAAAV